MKNIGESARIQPHVRPHPVAFTDLLSIKDEKFLDDAIALESSLDEAAGGGKNTHYRWELLVLNSP